MTSKLSQSVTSPRFDAFVASRFADAEKSAHGTLSRSAFDEWVKTRYEPAEHKANHAVPQSKFDEYVALMGSREKTSLPILGYGANAFHRCITSGVRIR